MKKIAIATCLIFGPAIALTYYTGTATITDRLGEHEKKYYNNLAQVVYPAWIKAHPGSPLTFPEWDALRKQKLLPK